MFKQLSLLTSGHAAVRLKISVSRVRQLEAIGQLRAIRDSTGRQLYVEEDVDELAARREVERHARDEQRHEREQQTPAHAEPRPAA